MASPLAMAQNKDDHSAHHPQGQAQPATGAEEAPAGTTTNAGPSALDQGMKHLQDLMTQIDQTSDPVEREALLHEHMIAMLEEIKLLQAQAEGMSMAMMMGGGQMGMMGGEKNTMAGEKKKTDKKAKGGGAMMGDGMMTQGMMGMHKVMEKRLDELQQLLEQAIKHAHMREAAEH